MAKTIMLKEHHLSYRSGTCSDHMQWLSTFAPPEGALSFLENGHIELNISLFRMFCQKTLITHVPWEQIGPIQKWENIWSLNINVLPTGILGIQCEPKDPQKGPESWFDIPVGNLTSQKLPREELLRNHGLWFWILALRGQNKLDRDHTLDLKAQEILKISPSVFHNKPLWEKISREVQKQNLILTGENKILGKDEFDIGFSLWVSPSHRALLFDPRAKKIGIANQKQSNGQLFMVMLLAL